jgi:transcriptional antiterminator NusG
MWYVIQVYTGKEEETADQCRARVAVGEEEVFVPLVERMTKVRGEWEVVRTRLFPGYVFIETDRPGDLYMRLKEVKAMTRLLKTGEEITPLYREEEEYLRSLEDEEHVVRYSEGYLEGERLVVTSGALKGQEGKIRKILRHKRLVVLEVPLLGREVEVTLGLGVVEKRQGGGNPGER